MHPVFSARLRVAALSFCLAGFAPISGDLHADSTNIVASKDNTLYEHGTGATANGSGVNFHTGRIRIDKNGGDVRRGLLFFDIASHIPAGATVTSAVLRLNCSRVKNSIGRSTALHRVLEDWGEGASTVGFGGAGVAAQAGDATWLNTFFGVGTWSTVGGTFVAGASASTTIGAAGTYFWSSAQMLADVQLWVDASSTNFGWVVIGVEGVASSVKQFDTRENISAANRPQLTIGFDPPAPDPDTDDDGMPDVWEALHFGGATNAIADADDDNDGASNLEEYIANTIPTNMASVFAIGAYSNLADRTIYFPSSTGRLYWFDFSEDLLTGVWTNLQTNIVGDGGTISVIDSNDPPRRTYRIGVELP